MQLRSSRRDQDPVKDRLPTSLCLWHEVRRWPECALSTSSAVCGSRWRRTWRQRAHCNASAASVLATRSGTADTLLSASRVGALTSLVTAQPHRDSLDAAAVRATTRRTTVDASDGKRRRPRLQSEHLSWAARWSHQAYLLLHLKQTGQDPLLSRWTWARDGATSSEGGILQRPALLNLSLNLSPRHPPSLKWQPPRRRRSLKRL